MVFAIDRYGPTGQIFGTFEAPTREEAIAAAIAHDAENGFKVERTQCIPLDLHNQRAKAMQAAEEFGGWDAAIAAMNKFNRDHGIN